MYAAFTSSSLLTVPEKSAIEGNVNRALLMADRSAMSYYKVLMEKGYFNRLIAGRHSPDHAGRQRSVRHERVSLPGPRLCHAEDCAREYRYRTVARNYLYADRRRAFDANPQGFLIGNLTVVENKDLRTYDR